MPFLIDGHNVISAMPAIELTDPHDEAKLVLKLRSWAARTRRKATIVFDGGLPGGYSRSLSGGGLEVVFAARSHTNADNIIKERLRHLPDASNWTVVSSDHEVRDAARRVGARTLTAQAFVKRIGRGPRLKLSKPEEASDEEVAAWLEVFGSADSALQSIEEEAQSPPTGQKRRRPTQPRAHRSQRSLGEQVGWTQGPADAGRPTKSEEKEKPQESSPEDVEHWLEVFGDGAAEAPPPERPTRRKDKRKLTVDKDHPEAQSDADVETWLTVFGAAESEEAPPVKKTPSAEKKAKRSKTLREHKRKRGSGFKGKTEGLSEEDIEMWHRLFGEEPDA
jgi:predicted RNA-binding protein with PIN domain